MKKTNKELKTEALEALSGKWGTAVGIFFVLSLVSSVCSMVVFIPIIGAVALYFLVGVIVAGMYIFSLNLLKGEGSFDDGFKGFNSFMRLGGGFALTMLFTVLWSFLFIIPGIIKAYSYSMTLYIMIEDPEIGITDAITKSREMMNGQKLDLFVLNLSFIGWAFLCLFTFGIGNLWLTPYMQVTQAAFYNDIKPVSDRSSAIPETAVGA